MVDSGDYLLRKFKGMSAISINFFARTPRKWTSGDKNKVTICGKHEVSGSNEGSKTILTTTSGLNRKWVIGPEIRYQHRKFCIKLLNFYNNSLARFQVSSPWTALTPYKNMNFSEIPAIVPDSTVRVLANFILAGRSFNGTVRTWGSEVLWGRQNWGSSKTFSRCNAYQQMVTISGIIGLIETNVT